MARRVVVTGLGPITPIGIGKDAFWEGLRTGRSGVRRVDEIVDLEGIDVKIGAPVLDFDPLEHMDRRRARRIDRSAQFGLVATKLALADARVDLGKIDPDRSGVIAGTGIGGLETMSTNFKVLFEQGPRRVSPFFIPRLMPNAVAGEIAIEYGLRGANFGVVSACASSAHAIGIAAELIRSDFIDLAVAGGAEAVLLPISYAGFTQIGALSKRNDEPSRASRPFDRDRDGFVIGEGAGILILEGEERARARGARIYAELAGFGMSDDAHHITAPPPDGGGAATAIRIALSRGEVSQEEVDYINAHGTSTPLNDRSETAAIKLALGEAAYNLKISSTKSQIGHLLGAAGAAEAIATLLAMENSFIPSTLNYENPEPECDLDYARLELVEEPKVVRQEGTDVVDLVAEHRHPLDPEAERESGNLLRIIADLGEDRGVDHPRPHDLEPVIRPRCLDVNLNRRLGEREEVPGEAHLIPLAEELPGKDLEDILQVRQRQALFHPEHLHLMEHRGVRRVLGIPPVAAARTDHPHRRGGLFHHPDLDR